MAHTVALVGSEHEENLSLRYLAGALEKAGYRAEIVVYDGDDDGGAAVTRILAMRPLVVGISVPFQHRAQRMLEVARDLRHKGYDGHVTIGGHFATFEFAAILKEHTGIDSVVRHEGEETLVELCDLLARAAAAGGRSPDAARSEIPGPIAGLVIRNKASLAAPHVRRLPLSGQPADSPAPEAFTVGPERPLPRLDDLPFPDRRGAPMDILGVPTSPMIGSRGCYADCSFCCIYAYAEAARGPRYRKRSVEQIVREMKLERERRGVKLFVFHDDNFFLPYGPKNVERYEEMAALLRAEGLTDIGIVIKCRPNDVDPHLFRVLKGMGVIRAYVGIETATDEGIVSLNRRITNDDNRNALRVFKELDLYASFNMLIFDPEATLDGVEQNLDFMEEHADVPWNFCRAEVYAGTPLKRTLESQGRLSGNYLAWNYEMREPRVEMLFRLATTAFFGRNFKSDGVSHLNMGLRFDAEVLRHFYPGAWDAELGARLLRMSRAVGEGSVKMMREAVAFARGASLSDKRGAQAFLLDLTRRVAREDLALLGEVKALRRELERRVGLAQGRGREFGEGMPAWAAETGRLGSSVGRELSTEVLPAPAGTWA